MPTFNSNHDKIRIRGPLAKTIHTPLLHLQHQTMPVTCHTSFFLVFLRLFNCLSLHIWLHMYVRVHFHTECHILHQVKHMFVTTNNFKGF